MTASSLALLSRKMWWQVLLAKGISEDDLQAELEEKLLDVDRMRVYDEGVNSVLVASAADEIQSLRNQIDQQATEIEQLKERYKALYRCKQVYSNICYSMSRVHRRVLFCTHDRCHNIAAWQLGGSPWTDLSLQRRN